MLITFDTGEAKKLLEALIIVVLLGGLEVVLWLIDRKELQQQTALLEEIATLLSLKEHKDVEVSTD